MTRYLLLISMVLLGSCNRKLRLPSDFLLLKENTSVELMQFIQVDRDSLKTYATAVSAYGKYFSGVTYFKNTQDTALRVLFTTHTGLKLLDLQLSDNGCSTVYAVEQLNNPVVLKLLCHDFGLVASTQTHTQASQVYRKQDGSEIIVKKEGKDVYYYTNPFHSTYQVIETVPGKLKIQTEVHQDTSDSSLTVKHRNFNFKMTLKKLTLD